MRNSECWERYMEAINAYPHHGFDTWLLFQEDGMKPNKGEVGKMKSQPNALNAKAGMYTLNEDIDMKAKVGVMTRRLEELKLKKIREVQAVFETPMQVMPCSICQSYEHLVEECPTIPVVREMFGIKRISLDNSSPITMLHMEIPTIQIGGTIQISLETKSTSVHCKEKGRFPSQTSPNPKGIHEVEAHEGESSQVRDIKAMITLRSGKEVELPTPKPHDETKSGKRDREEGGNKGNKKGSSGRKEDHDSTVNEDPERRYDDWRDLLEKALLDLGASVNLLPYSVYKQLELGELKPTSITLSLADRQGKIPIEMIEDVLVQEWTHATHVWEHDIGSSISTICKKPIKLEEEGLEEVCIIDTLVKEHCWRRIEEILPLFNEEEIQEAVKEEAPKLSLKPLPTELKYPYLEKNTKCLLLYLHLLPLLRRSVYLKFSGDIAMGESYSSSAKEIRDHNGANDKGEEVATHLTSGWRVCIDYRKWNVVTRNDHFPLPFIDQVLERVSGHPFYCFLDGFSGYFQIEIDVKD
ncbi:hypothetical protein CK203_110224 [Vitis vinifera]|uniref:Transposon Ty3-I Gag-Pol polyprotein n=1 Tax=Vitis vinifera TaxID=29760 RepID=A0A438BQ98_VITVI|nr:hypothetical protein CK203_110224 [Vitis vinifera]